MIEGPLSSDSGEACTLERTCWLLLALAAACPACAGLWGASEVPPAEMERRVLAAVWAHRRDPLAP